MIILFQDIINRHIYLLIQLPIYLDSKFLP